MSAAHAVLAESPADQSTVDRAPAGPAAPGAGPVPAAPRTVVAWPPRPRDRVLGIPVGLLVCWELAGLCALAGFGRPEEQAVLFWFAAVAVFGVSVLRLGRRWSYEWAALWWSHRRRRRRIRAARAGGRQHHMRIGADEWALVRALVSAESVTEVTLPLARHVDGADAGERVAVIEHAGGLSAVVEVAGLSADMLYLPLSLLPPFDPDGPEFALQAVLHVRASPPVDWAGGTLLVLVALRDPAWTSQRLRQALVVAYGKLLDRLRRQGYGASPVGVEQTTQMLRVLAMLDVAPKPDPAAPGAELWTRWRVGGVNHETVQVRSWSTPLPDVVRAALATMPSGMTITLAARRAHRYSGYPGVSEEDRVVAAQLHLRVSEVDTRSLSASARSLRRALRGLGAKVSGLDGRQGPGLAATLPLGGFVP